MRTIQKQSIVLFRIYFSLTIVTIAFFFSQLISSWWLQNDWKMTFLTQKVT